MSSRMRTEDVSGTSREERAFGENIIRTKAFAAFGSSHRKSAVMEDVAILIVLSRKDNAL